MLFSQMMVNLKALFIAQISLRQKYSSNFEFNGVKFFSNFCRSAAHKRVKFENQNFFKLNYFTAQIKICPAKYFDLCSLIHYRLIVVLVYLSPFCQGGGSLSHNVIQGVIK